MRTIEALSYVYAKGCIDGEICAPKYVKKQAAEFVNIWEGLKPKYKINHKRIKKIVGILKLLKMPKGLSVGKPIAECLDGFQWLLIVAALCVVHTDDEKKRRYEMVVLEIARKNGKTFIIAILFILLFFLEPKFSYFFSVAPDGALSREIKKAINEIISYNADILPKEGGERIFIVKRDEIEFLPKETKYIPLNYSNSRLDGKLGNVFLIDEVGALVNNYAIEAMKSSQLTILNKLGFVISTKYPKFDNPFEIEVQHCKNVLDGISEDETLFSLLYEPDNVKDWMENDEILLHANPLAQAVPEILDDLKKKRQAAIEMESKRENFLCKHCNILFSGGGTETFIPVEDVIECRGKIDWSGREVYLGVDLSMTNDNTAVAMAAYDEESEKILADVVAFVPEGRIDEKNRNEKIDYRKYINGGKCISCGDRMIDYSVVEEFVLKLEEKYNVKVCGLGFDRYNCLSSAQKWESGGIPCTEVRQHSSILHPPTKWLVEKITEKEFVYEQNELLEVNFQNAKCTFDTNMNRYVNKKKSNGKVDMVVALINALYMLQQNVQFGTSLDWVVQF